MDDNALHPPIGHVAHFAINADDVGGSRRFYEHTVGWRFEAWGPPDFFHIYAADGSRPGPIGALQATRELGGIRPAGFECTIAVDDADAAAARAVEAGGTLLMATTTIAGVGDLAFVRDPSGHPVGLMRYDSTAS
jgi:uncharacterized protein